MVAGEPRQQGCRLPEGGVTARLRPEAFDAAHDVVESDHVRVEHRSTPVQRKPVSGQIDDVDVGRKVGKLALDIPFENLDPIVDDPLDALCALPLAESIERGVYDRFGIRLEREPVVVG